MRLKSSRPATLAAVSCGDYSFRAQAIVQGGVPAEAACSCWSASAQTDESCGMCARRHCIGRPQPGSTPLQYVAMSAAHA